MTRQEHLLTILAEECNEVAQRCTKALRFGLEEVQPGQDLSNADRIEYELADLRAIVEMLGFDKNRHLDLVIDKTFKVERFLSYSAKCGTLEES